MGPKMAMADKGETPSVVLPALQRSLEQLQAQQAKIEGQAEKFRQQADDKEAEGKALDVQIAEYRDAIEKLSA